MKPPAATILKIKIFVLTLDSHRFHVILITVPHQLPKRHISITHHLLSSSFFKLLFFVVLFVCGFFCMCFVHVVCGFLGYF